MTQRKLKPLKYYHSKQPDEMTGGAEVLTIVVNRPLHPLEAMGIFHLISEEMK